MVDIIDAAVQTGQLKILMKALETSDLVDTLREDGPFTLFAPNDDAFVMLPQGVFQALMNDVTKLRQILLSHVVEGEHFMDDIMASESLTSIQGQDLVVDISDGLAIENADIVQSDIECNNGVIHIIDTVIAPKVPTKTKK